MRRAVSLTAPFGLIGLFGYLAITLVSPACGSSGGFVDAGIPAIKDAGFTPRDSGPGGTDADPNQPDTGEPPPDGGPGPDTGEPPPDGGPDEDGGTTPGATFTEQTIDSTIRHGQGVEVADIDGDGDLDLLSSLSLTDTVHLYVNDGSGNFSQVTVGTNIVAMETAVADLDGDNDLDIAAVGLFERSGGFTSPGKVVWYENPGNVTGAWTEHDITGFTFWGGLFIEAGDLTGDGRADLVVGAIQLNDVAGNPQGNGLHWFRNTGGAFSGPNAIDANLLEVSAVIVADVDNSGAADVIALGGSSSEVAWWDNQRDSGTVDDNPTFAKHVIGTPSAPYALHYVNMDEDPAIELLVTSADQGGSVVYFDPPAALSDLWSPVTVASGLGGPLASRVFAADLDGDQRTDVAVGFAEATTIAVFLQREAGQFTPQTIRNDYTGLNWLIGGDLDGDQRVDLVTATYERTAGADLLSWWKNE